MENFPYGHALFDDKLPYNSSRGRLLNGDGIGAPLIGRYVGDLLNEGEIKPAIATLKNSSRYAEILERAYNRAFAEQEEERLAAEQAERERVEAQRLAEEQAAAAEAARVKAKADAEAAALAKRKADEAAAAKRRADEELRRAKVAADTQALAATKAKKAADRATAATVAKTKANVAAAAVVQAEKAKPKIFDDRVAQLFDTPSHVEAFRRYVTMPDHVSIAQARLADVLERIAAHPMRELPALLPWNWRTSAATAERAAA